MLLYASCSQQKALFNLFLWLFSKSIPLKEYYPVWSFEAPMAVYLLVVLERNKQLAVVPIISALSFSHSTKGQMWILLSAFTPSALPHRVRRNLSHTWVQPGYQDIGVSGLQLAQLICSVEAGRRSFSRHTSFLGRAERGREIIS